MDAAVASVVSMDDTVRVLDLDLSRVFVVFSEQDSGCVSYGIEQDGRRLFVKTASARSARSSLRSVIGFHRVVSHPAIVRSIDAGDDHELTWVVYPWRDGRVLNAATVHGSDRSALDEFQHLPIDEVTAALNTIIDAHVAIAAAGYVAVDLYDGCFLYDFDARAMWLIDLDEYRRGAFRVEDDRLPGSTRYMAPEEFRRGDLIDVRTTVFNLGRAITFLLGDRDGWRGSAAQFEVAARATASKPDDRFPNVAALSEAWRVASQPTP